MRSRPRPLLQSDKKPNMVDRCQNMFATRHEGRHAGTTVVLLHTTLLSYHSSTESTRRLLRVPPGILYIYSTGVGAYDMKLVLPHGWGLNYASLYACMVLDIVNLLRYAKLSNQQAYIVTSSR